MKKIRYISLVLIILIGSSNIIFAKETTGEYINRVYKTQIASGDKSALESDLSLLEIKLKEASFVESINLYIDNSNKYKLELMNNNNSALASLKAEFNLLVSEYQSSILTTDLDLVLHTKSNLWSFLLINGIELGVGVNDINIVLSDSQYIYNGNPSLIIKQEIDEVLRKIKNLDISEDYGVIPKDYPIQGKITSEYGIRIDPISKITSFHTGQDIASPSGTLIPAWFNGTAIVVDEDSSRGKYVIIQQGDLATAYLHMSKQYIKVGDKVKQGDIIGEVGNTGRSTGSHLHLSLYINDIAVDPAKLIESEVYE